MILSVSRRTDIPSFYSEWFFNRLKAGYVLTKNPMNPAQVRRVLLSPEIIDCIVFWTKDPAPMMKRLPELDEMGYDYYFQYTITPYGLGDLDQGKNLEPNLRDKNEIINTFIELSSQLGKDRVLWRYDPIILNHELSISYHKEMFAYMCKKLEGYTEVCTISFVDYYRKLSKQVKEQLLCEITEEQMHEIAISFAELGQEYGIEVRACCEKVDLSVDQVLPAACIDQARIELLCQQPISVKQDKNQREGCGCVQSVDIGVYNTCKNGCVYCYANYSAASTLKNCNQHNPKSEFLI